MKQITNPDNNMWRSADPPQRTERVAARIGGGGLKVIDQEHGLSDKSGSVFKQSLEQINDRHLENNDIECIANGLYSNDKLLIDLNEVPERLQAELITDYDEFRHMIDDAQSIHHNEPDVYFYHSDHLGSASWITDNGGLAVQHLQYLPYGERYVDQRISGYSERFTFTGKEKDEETGYGYFGARYMDHELMTMWLSVDPMADKYPSISPYAYCAWNPVKLVDPDGRDIWDLNSEGELIWREASENDIIYAQDGSHFDMDEGILTRGQSYTKESTGGKGFHFHLGNNAEKADQIFEFFADNAGVEFSLLGMANTSEDAESGNFHLSSSFDPEGDTYGTNYAYAASKNGTLRDATHNHPNGNMQQSGLPEIERMNAGLDWSPNDKGDDVGFCASMKMNLGKSAPKAVFNAYIYAPKGKNPGMRNGGYTCYGSTNPSMRNAKYYKGTAHSRYSRNR